MEVGTKKVGREVLGGVEVREDYLFRLDIFMVFILNFENEVKKY